MDLGARAKILVTDGDIKQKKLAKQIGISESKLSHYLTGRYEMPTHVVTAIAEYFHVSTDYLLGLTDIPETPMPLFPSERQLLEAFRTLSRDQQEAVHNQVQFFQKQNQRR
ncbi:hypothetical protein N510_001838 [Firmicutes bacterium ASF500]|nr:hypothetical protein N510_001838 [Firmicutes bacterium ASF500]